MKYWLIGLYRFVYDFPINWKKNGYKYTDMTDTYWEGK